MSHPTVSATARPRVWGYGLSLGDRLFRLAVGPGRELTIQTAPLEAPRVNTTSSPEEATAEFGLTFARSRFDGGEGLFRAHSESAAPNRYWDSKNVSTMPADPGEFPEVRLLRAAEQIETSTDDGLRFAEAGGSLYVAEGTTIRRCDDVGAANPVFVDDDPHNGETPTTVEDVTSMGDIVYAALGANGIHRKVSGVWEHWSDTPATRVWEAKGRIIASDGAALYEVVAAGAAPAALRTLASGETFQDAGDGGSHVLVAATDGYVYAYSTDTGSLVAGGQTLFEGETPRAIGQSQGVVAIGTSSGNVGRMWVGQVSADNGQLGNLQLTKEWGDSGTVIDQAPRRIIGTRDALVTAVTDGTDVHLWRYELSTAGFSRHLSIEGATGVVRGLAFVDGRTFASVDGEGVWRPSSEYAASGYLIGPLGDFYSANDKSWIGARLETGPILGGARVSLYYTTDPSALNDPDSPEWKRVTSRESGSGDPGELSMTSTVARSLAGMVRLSPSSDGSQTPSVRSFSFRAYPSSGDEDVIATIPVNVSDQVERPGRARVRVPGRGAKEYQALLGYEGRPVLANIYLPKQTLTIRGLVEEVATPIQALTSRGSVTVVSQVRIRGRRTSGSGLTSGTGAYGTYHLYGSPPTYAEID